MIGGSFSKEPDQILFLCVERNMDFTELRLALVETMKEASRFILDKDLKQFSSATDL